MARSIPMTLFRIKGRVGAGPIDIPYQSVDECLDDEGLQRMLESDAATVCAVFRDDLRITRDVETWNDLSVQLGQNRSLLEESS